LGGQPSPQCVHHWGRTKYHPVSRKELKWKSSSRYSLPPRPVTLAITSVKETTKIRRPIGITASVAAAAGAGKRRLVECEIRPAQYGPGGGHFFSHQGFRVESDAT